VGEQQGGDDAHGLLGVVAAVAQRIGAAETNCSLRNTRSAKNGELFRKVH
jgi:hypothetical protein